MATPIPLCWQGRHEWMSWHPERYFPDVEVRICRRCQRQERRKKWTYNRALVPVRDLNRRTRQNE